MEERGPEALAPGLSGGGGVNRAQRGGQEGTTGDTCHTPASALLTIRSRGSGRSWVRSGGGFQLMMCES